MKTFTRLFLTLLLLFGFYGNASAFQTLLNWNLDVTGTAGNWLDGNADGVAGDVIDIASQLNIQGFGYAENTGLDLTSTPPDLVGTFKNWGVLNATGTNDDNLNPNYEITAIYSFAGDINLATNSLNFTSGTLELYIDDLTNADDNNDGTLDENYNTGPNTNSILGANDGLLVAEFKVDYGLGSVGDNATLDQDNINVFYTATSMMANYFYDENGIDLSTKIGAGFLLGFSNTTGVTSAVADRIKDELGEFPIDNPPVVEDPPNSTIISTGGQFELSVVPEPTTMLLFGFGLLGLAGMTRKKVV